MFFDHLHWGGGHSPLRNSLGISAEQAISVICGPLE